MARKKKEKPLTLEEALDQIKKDLKHLWINASPLICAFSAEPDQEPQAFPLDPAFTKKTWVMCFLDPTTFERDYVLNFCVQLHQRYSRMDFGLLLVFIPRYQAFSESNSLLNFLQRRKLSLPVCVDENFSLSKALQIEKLPSVALLEKETAQLISRRSGDNIFKDFEAEIKKVLWKYDPGLSVPTNFEVPPLTLRDSDTVEFVQPPEAGTTSAPTPVPSTSIQYKLLGEWKPSGDALLSEDPLAGIEVTFKGTDFALVARSNSVSFAATRAFLDLKGVKKSQQGSDCSGEDAGSLVFRLEAPRRTHCLKNLPDQIHTLKIRFVDASKIAVAIYALRVGTNRP